MKHLLNGVAIAAALAIAAPAWAQAPMTPGGAGAPSAAAPAAPAAKQKHRPVRHAAKKGGKKAMRASAGNSMTEQLNREELARIQGGGMAEQPMGAMPPGPANAGAGQGGPRASGR
jgi:hypothetical protein